MLNYIVGIILLAAFGLLGIHVGLNWKTYRKKVKAAASIILLLLGISGTVIVLMPDIPPTAASNTWQISASTDDCRRGRSISNGDFFYTDSIGNPVGYVTGTFMAQGNGLRFNDINIDQGITINSARLNVCSRNAKAGVICNSNITCEAVDNATTFTDMANYDGRTHTGNYTHWDAIPAWTAETWYLSPDFKSSVQEVIDRPLWESGNSLVVFWDDHDDRSSHVADAIRVGYSWDNAPSKTPILNITWAADSAPTYSNIDYNTTIAGAVCELTCKWTDDFELDDCYFNTNTTGSWQGTNTTVWLNAGVTTKWANVSITLNDTVGTYVAYRWWCSDNASLWGDTGVQGLTTTQGGILGQYSFESDRRTGLRFAPQQKVFYAQNRHWVFYGNDTSDKIEYRTSTDGLIFSSAITIYDPLAETFATWNNNTHVAIVVDTGNYSSSNAYIPYRLGELETDGAITWATGSWQTALDITGANFIRPNVYVAADGTPWVTASNATYTTGTSHVTRSSEKNGTWVTDSGFPVDTNLTITHHSYRGALFELSNVGMYLIAYDYNDRVEGRLYNYTTDGWESIEQELSTWNVRRVDYAIDCNNVIHIIAGDISGSPICYLNRTATGFSSRLTVGAYDTGSPVYRGETVVTHGEDVYLFWRNTTTTIIQMNKTDGSWNTKFVWKTTAASGTDNGMNGFCNGAHSLIGFAWETGTSNPRTLRYDFFNLDSTFLAVGWNEVIPWSIDVTKTLGNLNASLNIDNINWTVITIDYNNNTQWSLVRYWNGSSWVVSEYNSDKIVNTTSDTIWIACYEADKWEHTYP